MASTCTTMPLALVNLSPQASCAVFLIKPRCFLVASLNQRPSRVGCVENEAWGGTPLSKAGGLGRAQGTGLTYTRCQSLLTGPEIPHSQAHASSALSPALSPWPGRSGQAGSAPRAERKGCSPALQGSQVVHQAEDLHLLQRWLDGARLPGSTSGLPPCSHRLGSPLCAIPQDAAL